MKKTDQNSLISLFKPIFKNFKALSGSIFLFFWNVKYRRERVFLIFIIFFEKSMGQ